MDDLLKEMGQRLVARRKHLGLTQDELAERSDLTTQTISTSETGRKALRPENIIKLSEALDVSVEYLLLGKVSDTDVSILGAKVSKLTPDQYRHLEDIIDSFIAAVTPKNTES